jgi:hypothetical protein
MADLRLGMVGLDTSHCTAFTELLHDEKNKYHVNGGRVTVGYPGGSKDFSSSINRVDKLTAQLKDEYGVKIVDTIEEAAEGVDAVFLESVDGRQHLEQFRKLAPFGKPVFIDKPFACALKDAQEILELSRKYGSPVFSCSAIRYAEGIDGLEEGKRVIGCQAFGPAAILPDYPGYFWYGIHSAEVLFSKMGRGCSQVSVERGGDADLISGLWKDGRLGTIYGYRIEEAGTFGCSVFGKGFVGTGTAKTDPPYYAMMLPHILKFFREGERPVDPQETVETIAFLEAANESRETGAAVELVI